MANKNARRQEWYLDLWQKEFGKDRYFTTSEAARVAHVDKQVVRRRLIKAKAVGIVRMESVTSDCGICVYWSFGDKNLYIEGLSEPVASEDVTFAPQLFGDERARYLEIKTYHEKFGRSYPTERTTNVQKIQS